MYQVPPGCVGGQRQHQLRRITHTGPGLIRADAGQARAVANRTDACFIRVIGSELVQKYVGEGARMVRELFQMARSKKACIIFFDEVDAIGGARHDDGAGEHCQLLERTLGPQPPSSHCPVDQQLTA